MRMENFFYFLAIVQIAVGAYLIWQGLQWLGYARRRMFTDPGFNAPRVAVLCPCKGVEPGPGAQSRRAHRIQPPEL